MIPFSVTDLKPSLLKRTWYSPGGSSGTTKKPASLVTALRILCVSTLVTATETPGTKPPEASRTVPPNSAAVCGQRVEELKMSPNANMATELRRDIRSILCDSDPNLNLI